MFEINVFENSSQKHFQGNLFALYDSNSNIRQN